MKLFKSLLPFMVMSSLFLIAGLVLVITTEKVALHLGTNAFVGGPQDQFFSVYTHVGDGIVVPIIILIICLIAGKNLWANLALGITNFALSGLIAQFFKRVVFPDVFRPKTVLGDQLHFIEGVDVHGSFSFPSGHSTVSFALFIFIAFVFRKHLWLQILAAVMAILAAYSRVHISQHFVEDILAGAFIGITSFYLFHWTYNSFIFKGKLDPQV